MKTWMQALRLLAAGWKWWAAAACVLAGAGGMVVLWLRAPLATGMDLAIQAGYTVGALGCLVWALAIVKRRFAAGGVRLLSAMQRAEFWGAVALFAAGAVWLPWRLVTWVPRFESLAAQAWSAGARLLLAWALFTGGVCWSAACLGLMSEEKDDGETVQAGERENPAAD